MPSLCAFGRTEVSLGLSRLRRAVRYFGNLYRVFAPRPYPPACVGISGFGRCDLDYPIAGYVSWMVLTYFRVVIFYFCSLSLFFGGGVGNPCGMEPVVFTLVVMGRPVAAPTLVVAVWDDLALRTFRYGVAPTSCTEPCSPPWANSFVFPPIFRLTNPAAVDLVETAGAVKEGDSGFVAEGATCSAVDLR